MATVEEPIPVGWALGSPPQYGEDIAPYRDRALKIRQRMDDELDCDHLES
jgi:hypothetical protein